jgi:hypothetical protein
MKMVYKETKMELIKFADAINKSVENYRPGMDVINPDNGIINKNAKFNLSAVPQEARHGVFIEIAKALTTPIYKGAENELWTPNAYDVPALGHDTPVLNVCATFDNGDNSDTLHVPTITAGTPVTTLMGSTPNNSDSAFSPGVVDINTKNQTNVRWSFTTVQERSMSFALAQRVLAQQMRAEMKEIQTQVLIIANEGAASGNRGERAFGDAMTLALLETAYNAILNNGGDPMNLFMTADPNTIGKIAAITEATSGHSIFQRYDYSQSEYLRKGMIGEVLGMKVLRTLLPTQDDDWSGRETGVYCQTVWDLAALVVGINTNYSILSLPVLNNPGTQYNLQFFWGAGVLNSNLIAPIKMYEA